MKKETIMELLGYALENGKTDPSSNPFEIGKAYFIRTVTMYYTGRVVNKMGKFIQLGEAAWISDTGRFSDAIKTGEFNEVEPFSYDPWINTDATIDFGEIVYKIPNTKK